MTCPRLSGNSWHVWEQNPALHLRRDLVLPFDCVKTVHKREKPKELCFFQLGFEWQRFSWRRHKACGRLKEDPLLRGRPEVSGRSDVRKYICTEWRWGWRRSDFQAFQQLGGGKASQEVKNDPFRNILSESVQEAHTTIT